MKKLMMLAPLAAALFFSRTAPAQVRFSDPQYRTVQYAAPVFPYSCEVNGVVYGVDAGSRIWAENAVGQWFIIGRIVAGPYGYVAIRNDGARYPAVCE